MNMTIARGLKEKNRLAGRIADLQRKLVRYNRYEKGKEQDLDAKELMVALQDEWAYLINLKTRIAVANAGIAEKLVRLSEAKSELAFWSNFSNAGPAESTDDFGVYDTNLCRTVTVPKTMISVFTSKYILEQVERVTKLVEMLQDEIDDYNAKTQV